MRVERFTVSVGSDRYINRNVIIIVNECTMPLSNVMGLFRIEIASVQWIHATTLTPATVPTTAKQIRSHNNDKEQRHCAYKSVHIKSNIDYGWQKLWWYSSDTFLRVCLLYFIQCFSRSTQLLMLIECADDMTHAAEIAKKYFYSISPYISVQMNSSQYGVCRRTHLPAWPTHRRHHRIMSIVCIIIICGTLRLIQTIFTVFNRWLSSFAPENGWWWRRRRWQYGTLRYEQYSLSFVVHIFIKCVWAWAAVVVYRLYTATAAAHNISDSV